MIDEPVSEELKTSRRSFLHASLLYSGVAGGLLFNIIVFSFGIIAPNYDVMRQPIGELQLLPHGWIQSANFIVVGLLLITFAAGLRKEMRSGYGTTMIPLLQALTGVGLILSALFLRGPGQFAAMTISFLPQPVSFFMLAHKFSIDARWTRWVTYTRITAILMIVTAAAFVYARHNGGAYAGIFERLTIAARLVWIFIFSVALKEGRRLSPGGQ